MYALKDVWKARKVLPLSWSFYPGVSRSTTDGRDLLLICQRHILSEAVVPSPALIAPLTAMQSSKVSFYKLTYPAV